MSWGWMLIALVGCVSPGAVSCPDGRVCPEGLACATVNAVPYCVQESQLGCGAEGVACEAGTCHSDVCLPSGCGNALVDVGEVCDAGDTLPGNGCSATCTSTETCGNGVVDAVAGEQCDSGVPGLSNDGCTSTCGVEALVWVDISPRPIEPRSRAAIAYDSQRDITLLFGGVGESQLFGDTWEWNGSRWKRRVTGGAPAARGQFPMVYDSARDRFVMFGGIGSSFLGDTWEFDGTSWVQRVTAVAPSPRAGASMAYHPGRNETLLFGGYNTAPISDTWVWNGTTWTQQTTPSALVATSGTSVMAYDPINGEIVLYVDSKTWTWNGSWTQESPATAVGFATLDSMTFDSVRNKVIAFNLDTLFAWNGVDWENLGNFNGVNPGAIRGPAIAFDVARGSLVLFGGDNFGTAVSNNTWLWDGIAWTLKTVDPVSPGPRTAHDMVYDSKRGQIVLFGGGTDEPLSDTWLWSEEGWELVAVSIEPVARAWHAMAYDSARGRVVMFGGGNNPNRFLNSTTFGDTWEWDGKTWSEVSVTGPQGRRFASLAYDATSANTVLFGGAAGVLTQGGYMVHGDTWTFDGASWVQRTPANAPSARAGAGLAYDPLRGRVVLFGGFTNLLPDVASNETWEWDGSTWTKLSPATSPAPRGHMSMVFDPDRGRIVLVSGLGVGGGIEDIWEWDGTNWSQVVASGLAVQQRLMLAHHATEHRLIAFGGPGYYGAQGDTVALQYRSPLSQPERCLFADLDEDLDGLTGCGDPDCWARCTPTCPPETTCPATAQRCGDGVCGVVESFTLCPADCF